MVFSTTTKGIAEIIAALGRMGETRECRGIHSGMKPKGRTNNQAWLERIQVGIIVASQTISHSVNIAHLNAVVTAQPYEDYWQWDAIMGRAGRRGVRGTGYMFHCGAEENETAASLQEKYGLANGGRDVTVVQCTG